jgi:hypothetical protein
MANLLSQVMPPRTARKARHCLVDKVPEVLAASKFNVSEAQGIYSGGRASCPRGAHLPDMPEQFSGVAPLR